MRIVAIGDAVTVDAFRLMGICGETVKNAEEARAALEASLEPETVILIAESAAELIRDRVDELKTSRGDYLVLEVPSGEEGPSQADQTAQLISQAIGIKV